MTEQRWKFSVAAEMAQIRGIFGETERELEAHGGVSGERGAPVLQRLRKFKIVLLKMKNNKLVSLQEYNEVLNILLEMEI